MTDKPSLTIDVVSDPVCPWCYIGKRALDRAVMALSFSHDLTLRFRPYQLNPDMPKEGMNRRDYYAQKFPDETKRAELVKALEGAAANVGVMLDVYRPEWQPNTLDAHRVSRWAALEDCQADFMEALFKAYWDDGANIGDHEVLAGIAGRVGMDGEDVAARLATKEDCTDVAEEADAFRAGGVTGVPTFIVNEKTGFAGALPPDKLLEAFRQLADETRG